MAMTVLRIPAAVRSEHEEIHAALVEAANASGRVGVAAKELAFLLHPHFVREEEVALPPLGLLASLASGTPIPEAERSAAVKMSESLRHDMPRMLEEHNRIKAAVERLRAAAQAEQSERHERLARQLALHAETEEQVLYPAAMLVGDFIRSRLSVKR